MRQLYLAATGQNRGKTTAALGLVDGFIQRGYQTGFMKPVGQRTVIDDGVPADEDAVLMRAVFDLPEPYPVMRIVKVAGIFSRSDSINSSRSPSMTASSFCSVRPTR